MSKNLVGVTRRHAVVTGLAGTALLAAPAILRAQGRIPVAKVSVLVNESPPRTPSWNRYAKAIAESVRMARFEYRSIRTRSWAMSDRSLKGCGLARCKAAR